MCLISEIISFSETPAETETQMEDNSGGDNEKSKKERKTEEEIGR